MLGFVCERGNTDVSRYKLPASTWSCMCFSDGVGLCTVQHLTNLATLDCVPIKSPSKSSRCWWLWSPVSLFSRSRATQNWAPISSSSLVPIWRPWGERVRTSKRIQNTTLFIQRELSHRKISQSGRHVQRVRICSMQLNLKPNFKSLTEIYIKMAAVGFFW